MDTRGLPLSLPLPLLLLTLLPAAVTGSGEAVTVTVTVTVEAPNSSRALAKRRTVKDDVVCISFCQTRWTHKVVRKTQRDATRAK